MIFQNLAYFLHSYFWPFACLLLCKHIISYFPMGYLLGVVYTYKQKFIGVVQKWVDRIVMT